MSQNQNQYQNNQNSNPNEKALARVSKALTGFRDKFSLALPKNRNVDQEISSVIATVAASLALQRCTPESIALAAYDAATLGLPVNKLGLAWLVPFGQEAKLQIGYRGYIQLVIESGFVLDVSAECAYSNDKFKYILGSNPSIFHEPPITGSRGNFIAVYAIARLANGLLKHVVMSKEQVEHIKSKSKSSGNGPWVTDYDEMAKKSVIKRLCKSLPYNTPGLNKVELATEMESFNNQSTSSYQSTYTADEIIDINPINNTDIDHHKEPELAQVS